MPTKPALGIVLTFVLRAEHCVDLYVDHDVIERVVSPKDNLIHLLVMFTLNLTTRGAADATTLLTDYINLYVGIAITCGCLFVLKFLTIACRCRKQRMTKSTRPI